MPQNKTERVMVRLTPKHMEEIQAQAAAEGFKLSEWVRLTAIQRARQARQGGGELAPAA